MARSEERPSSNKRRRRRRRRNDGSAATGRHKKKKHLYLALDDWKGGYSIHKLDADDMEPSGRLPEPAAQRLTAAFFGPMAFVALGTNIFIDTSTLRSRSHAPPTLVYNTESASLTVGPRLPDALRDLGAAMAVGEKLYAVTTVYVVLNQSPSLQVMSWAPSIKVEPWDPNMDWSWSSLPTSPPPFNGSQIRSYALHPDGHTIFMSTSNEETHSFDTSNGVWRSLGD
ncbi:hypothetical protein QOZ80_2BG0190020 [Eleusine coracana subsp. coracana]|nr:hypothetical protein QOZ80_2BG0190020 [Eleusine coracana subsp. coracana]